jgi:hypothetical protein
MQEMALSLVHLDLNQGFTTSKVKNKIITIEPFA